MVGRDGMEFNQSEIFGFCILLAAHTQFGGFPAGSSVDDDDDDDVDDQKEILLPSTGGPIIHVTFEPVPFCCLSTSLGRWTVRFRAAMSLIIMLIIIIIIHLCLYQWRR